MFNISLPFLMGIGLLVAAPSAARAAACGTMSFGETAGSVTIGAFLESIEAELSKRPDAKTPVAVETITFGLG